MSTLDISTLPARLRGVRAAHGDLAGLKGEAMVIISSITVTHIDPTVADPMARYEATRYAASLRAAAMHRAAGIRQVVMCGAASNSKVASAFGRQGAIVVTTPRDGLATPYLDAARLVRAYAGEEVSVVKAEADKRLDRQTLAAMLKQLRAGYDVLVGDRTVTSLESMSAVQQATETVIDAVIADLLGIPRGASSGVQVYGPAGLEAFLGYEALVPQLGNNWKYLIYTPAAAKQRGLKVGPVPAGVLYDQAMVQAEDMPLIFLKRLEQLLVMLEGALEVSKALGNRSGYLKPSPERRQAAQTALDRLRNTLSNR